MRSRVAVSKINSYPCPLASPPRTGVHPGIIAVCVVLGLARWLVLVAGSELMLAWWGIIRP
jgi:hypothetical protein